MVNTEVVDFVSKQAVKNLVHETEIYIPVKKPAERKKVRYLHIVADEDHVAAQFWKEKGDLKEGVNKSVAHLLDSAVSKKCNMGGIEWGRYERVKRDLLPDYGSYGK